MRQAVATGCLALLLAAGGAGCASYYKVSDPTTGKVYYTDGYFKPASMGATFKDGRTGNEVTLQNSDIEQITKEEYEHDKVQPLPAAAPAPAPAAAAPAAAPTGAATPAAAASPNVFQ
jgi:hypothetical protein